MYRNANGAVAGMYIMANSSGDMQNNTSDTNIIFEADQVVIRDTNSGGTNIQPFTVLTSTDSDGNAPGVYMNAVYKERCYYSCTDRYLKC